MTLEDLVEAEEGTPPQATIASWSFSNFSLLGKKQTNSSKTPRGKTDAVSEAPRGPLLPFELLSSSLLPSVFTFLGAAWSLPHTSGPISTGDGESWPQYTGHGMTVLVGEVAGSPCHPDLPFQSWGPGSALGAVLACRDLGPSSPMTSMDTPTPG